MREVAARAGVTMSSVSRVLSDHSDASDAMHERVLAAVAELGYQPDGLRLARCERDRVVVPRRSARGCA
jgi:DNA-binding LacI/PurR family transcriptional regulator